MFSDALSLLMPSSEASAEAPARGPEGKAPPVWPPPWPARSWPAAYDGVTGERLIARVRPAVPRVPVSATGRRSRTLLIPVMPVMTRMPVLTLMRTTGHGICGDGQSCQEGQHKGHPQSACNLLHLMPLFHELDLRFHFRFFLHPVRRISLQIYSIFIAMWA